MGFFERTERENMDKLEKSLYRLAKTEEEKQKVKDVMIKAREFSESLIQARKVNPVLFDVEFF
jgi:hypothetical protein